MRTNASVLLNNIGLSSASIDLAVRQGALEAHGGVIGGYIEVSEIAVDGGCPFLILYCLYLNISLKRTPSIPKLTVHRIKMSTLWRFFHVDFELKSNRFKQVRLSTVHFFDRFH